MRELLAVSLILPWLLTSCPATQGALAALGGREGVVNVAPSLISLAGAVVNVAPGKACKSVKIDPDLIKVRGLHVPEHIMPQDFVIALSHFCLDS